MSQVKEGGETRKHGMAVDGFLRQQQRSTELPRSMKCTSTAYCTAVRSPQPSVESTIWEDIEYKSPMLACVCDGRGMHELWTGLLGQNKDSRGASQSLVPVELANCPKKLWRSYVRQLAKLINRTNLQQKKSIPGKKTF